MVPQGGNTGYCGGATPDESGREVVISLERLRQIRALDAQGFTLTAEAGVTLAELQTAAAAGRRLFPLSMGSEGSCQLGGVLSTNAGGLAVLRYGTARELVLGLEVVLPDGEIWHGLSALRKDGIELTPQNLDTILARLRTTIDAVSKGVFDKMMRTYEALAPLQAKNAGLRLRFNYTFSRKTEDHFEATWKFVTEELQNPHFDMVLVRRSTADDAYWGQVDLAKYRAATELLQAQELKKWVEKMARVM
jgi:hypothetical protein